MSMSIPSDTFTYARQWSECFVETGTHRGLGLLAATYARFERMHTCEIDPVLKWEAQNNMGTQFGKIHYYLGDSGTMLTRMLEAADERCAVLLDAHMMGEDAEAGKCPLREELLALVDGDRDDHLILIDDIDLCGTPRLGWITLDEVRAALRRVNPAYSFSLLNGIRPKMLLVASPPHCPLSPHACPLP